MTDQGGGRTGFAISYDGLEVELTVDAAPPGAEPLDPEAVALALRRAPPADYSADAIAAVIAEARGLAVAVGSIRVPSNLLEPWFVTISPDRVAAYLVPLSPSAAPTIGGDSEDTECDRGAEGGTTVDTAALRRSLATLGVRRGHLAEVLASFTPARPLDGVTCLALGELPTPGRDAQLVFHFDRTPQQAASAMTEGRIDHHAAARERFVEEGALLVECQPPVPGDPGSDLDGKPVAPAPVTDQDLAAMIGEGVAREGRTLVATRAGRPLDKDGRILVLPVFEVAGDLDFSVGHLRFPGDVIVHGDVRPGFRVEADGDVIVDGVSEAAMIRATQNIQLGGVPGNGDTTLSCGGELVATFVHRADIEARTVTVVRELMGCSVRAEQVRTDPQGRIVGGEVTATATVDAGSLGSAEGISTEIRLAPTGSQSAPVVRVQRRIYPGVRLRIQGAVLATEDAGGGASFWQVGGAIVTAPVDARRAPDPATAAGDSQSPQSGREPA